MLVRALIAAGIVVALIFWLRSRTDAAATTGGDGASAPRGGGGDHGVPVQVAKAVEQDVPIWLEGLGQVAAYQQVTVHTQVDGRLDAVLFTEGAPVTKGQVLAQVDPRPFQVLLHTAEGQLARDTAQHKDNVTNAARQKSLRDQNLVSQMAVDDAAALAGESEGAMRVDEAAVENAKLQLDYAQIKSPLDGVAGVRLVDAGNVVHAADQTGIVVVTEIDKVAVYFSVAEDDLSAIAQAMQRGPAQVEVRTRDGAVLLGTGTASALDNAIQSSTATLRVKAVIENPKRALWPGQFVKARILVDTAPKAIVVPTVAVQRGPQGTYVYLAVDGKAKMMPVEIGAQVEDQTIVTKGVGAGDQVVVEGANQLRPDAKIELPHDKAGPGVAGGPDAGGGHGKGGGRSRGGKP
jgi:multidrug efflux system membrane fusion protein